MAAKKTAKKSSKKAVKKTAAPKRSAKRSPAKKAASSRKTAKVAKPTIVHWEIQAKDAKRIQRFYADLFGWTIEASNPMNYGMVASGGKDAINGGIGGSPNGASRVLVYASVADIDDVLSKAEALGARTLMPRTDVGPVIMGIFEDVEGNQFGLVEGG